MYNPLVHSPISVKALLVDFCKEKKIQPREGEYQVLMSDCKEYLEKIFDNIPVRTVESILDRMIIRGVVFTRPGKTSRRWYIIIPDKNHKPAVKEVEE